MALNTSEAQNNDVLVGFASVADTALTTLTDADERRGVGIHTHTQPATDTFEEL